MGKSHLRNRPWWNWLLGCDSDSPAPPRFPIFSAAV